MDREARGGTLILGGGFAGSYVARLLKKRGATIVSPENFMLFASMLPEAASGTLEPRHVVVPLRQLCPHAELVLGRAIAHEPGARRVRDESGGGGSFNRYEGLPVAAPRAAALGARRRRAEDPPRDPDAARRLRGGGAGEAWLRHPRRNDAR